MGIIQVFNLIHTRFKRNKKAYYRICWHKNNEPWDLDHVGHWKYTKLEDMKYLCDSANSVVAVDLVISQGIHSWYWVEKKGSILYKKVYSWG